MFTKEENELLTHVGPGTPAGELLRRYWLPVAVAQELTDESPTMHVRILGEDLVLFRDKRGRVGLLDDRCPHRGASVLYGRVEERGIACAYHGWLFDTTGDCLECPAEPAESKFHLTVKHKAYPVQNFSVSTGPTWGRSLRLCCQVTTSGCAKTVEGGSSSSHSSTATGFRRWRIPWTRPISRFFTRR
ncbi:MAG: Rieske 2Fe-2S domain-containing protein [Candidatus Binatia bacterium]